MFENNEKNLPFTPEEVDRLIAYFMQQGDTYIEAIVKVSIAEANYIVMHRKQKIDAFYS